MMWVVSYSITLYTQGTRVREVFQIRIKIVSYVHSFRSSQELKSFWVPIVLWKNSLLRDYFSVQIQRLIEYMPRFFFWRSLYLYLYFKSAFLCQFWSKGFFLAQQPFIVGSHGVERHCQRHRHTQPFRQLFKIL